MKYIKTYIAVLLTLFVVSCEKQLNQNNPVTFSDDNAYRTIQDVQLGVNGAFGRYAAIIPDIYKNSLTSDEAKIGEDNGGSGQIAFRFQYHSDNAETSAGYYEYYSLIDQVNRILPHIGNVTGGNTDRKNELTAQLLGLRALGHFGLLQSFCGNYNPSGLGVPVMTEATVGDITGKPARNSMADVMTQIETDIANAKSLFPETTAGNFSDTVLNKLNLTAFQARISLYKGDYDAAINYASEVINSGLVALASGTDYQNIWQDLSYSESLFRVRLLQSSALGGQYTGPGFSAIIAPSDKLTNAYDAADIRLATFIGTTPAGHRYVKKHGSSSRGPSIVDVKACRLSEMYLIRSEAYAKKSAPDIASGAADLNTLRSNRIFGYVNENFGSAAALADAVIEERFKELCFEGFRFYDLKRNNLPVQRAASDASPAWETLPAGSPLFVYPIPLDAIKANPNLVQNPGY